MANDVPQRPHDLPHRCRPGDRRVVRAVGRPGDHPGLGQPSPGERDVDQDQRRSGQSRPLWAPEHVGIRSDDRADAHAEAGGRRQPPQGFGPLVRRHRVGDIGLRHAGGAAAEALNEPAGEEQPQAGGEAEDQVRRGGGRETDQQDRSPAVAVGDPPPERRGEELRHRERAHERPDEARRGPEPHGEERQQRGHDHQTDHVHEANRDERDQPLHRLAPNPSTMALTTIKTTPNAAATPISETRRLDMISIEIGRLS